MRNTLLLLSLIMFFSCSHPENSLLPVLSRADLLLQIGYADSALILLDSFPVDDLTTVSLQARHALLLTQAMDKNYITLTGDSLIRIAVKYYDSTNDLSSRAKAHYYWGRVHQDMGDVEGTVREFLTAMPLAKKAKEHTLMCLLQGNLGYLCWEHGLLDEADSLYKEEIQLTELHRDSLHWAMALAMRGDICMERGEEYYAEAESCLKQALMIVKASFGMHLHEESEIVRSLGYLYERMSDFSKTTYFINYYMTLQPYPESMYECYLLLGSTYYKQEKRDSAKVYLDKCLSSSSYSIKEGAYMRLADIARAEGKETDAVYYEKCSLVYEDSVRQLEKPVEIVTLSKDILYRQAARKYASSSLLYQYCIGGLVILLLLAIVLFTYKRKYKKHEEVRLLKEHKSSLLLLEKFQQEIDTKEKEMLSLKRECDEYDNGRLRQTQLISAYEELLMQKNEICIQLENQRVKDTLIINQLQKKNFISLIENTPIYHRLLELIKVNKENPDLKEKLNEKEWEELETEIGKLFPEFIRNLSAKYTLLLMDDIHFCCLVRFGFKKAEIQYILSRTLDAVYKYEKALKGRMQISKDVKLDELLKRME